MKTDLVEIFQTIRANLQPYTANGFTATINSDTEYELWADQRIDTDGGKKDIICFSSVKIAEDHVKVCVIPLTEEPELQKLVNPDLLNILVENCFQIKELDDKLTEKISNSFAVAFTSYKQKGWI